jgi:hypothetical protein
VTIVAGGHIPSGKPDVNRPVVALVVGRDLCADRRAVTLIPASAPRSRLRAGCADEGDPAISGFGHWRVIGEREEVRRADSPGLPSMPHGAARPAGGPVVPDLHEGIAGDDAQTAVAV